MQAIQVNIKGSRPRRALVSWRKLDDQHPRLAFAHYGLAQIHQQREQTGLAEQELLSALDLLTPRPGTDPRLPIRVLDRLAGLLAADHRHREAAELYNRLVQTYEQIHGSEHRKVGLALVQLGDELGELREHKAAASVYSRALTILEPILDPNHVLIGRLLLAQANCLFHLGKRKTAQALKQRAAGILFRRHHDAPPEPQPDNGAER